MQDYVTSLTNVEKILIHHITQIAPASAERLQEICEATSKDHTLKLLAKIVHEGWPKTETVPAVYSHIGTSEMKSDVKMGSCTKESD